MLYRSCHISLNLCFIVLYIVWFIYCNIGGLSTVCLVWRDASTDWPTGGARLHDIATEVDTDGGF